MFFYIHGFNSGRSSSSVENLSRYIPGVIPLQWDCSERYENNISYLIEQIHCHIDNSDFRDITLIGTSMGGYYARAVADILSEEYNVSCVLFNPVINPSEQISQFLGINVNYSTRQVYEFTEEVLSSYPQIMVTNKTIPVIIFVSDADEVLPGNVDRVEHTYRDCAIIHHIHTPHRISDYGEYIDAIRSVHGVISYICE